MTGILVYVIIVLVLIALAIWAIGFLTMLPPTVRSILMGLVVLVGILAIGHQAALW